MHASQVLRDCIDLLHDPSLAEIFVRLRPREVIVGSYSEFLDVPTDVASGRKHCKRDSAIFARFESDCLIQRRK